MLSNEEKGRAYFDSMSGWLNRFLKPELDEDDSSRETFNEIMDFLNEEGVRDIFAKLDLEMVSYIRVTDINFDWSDFLQQRCIRGSSKESGRGHQSSERFL